MKQESYKHVVIGGGVIGLSTAYHLARHGCTEVLLLEQNELASGTSWHAAGIVGPLRATMNLTHIAKYALTLIPELEQETGQQTGYKQTGGFWLAESEDRLIELKRIKAMGDMNGLHARFFDSAAVRERFPLLNVSDVVGALWVDEDGQVNPYDLCMAYAKGARTRGVEIREQARVQRVDIVDGAVRGVVLEDETYVRCDTVINCAGLWARDLGEQNGVCIPLQAVEHMYVVTEPIPDLPKPCPLVRDMKGALYIKEDAGRLVIGTFESNARLWDWRSVDPDRSFLELPENWDHLEPMLQAAQHRIPCLDDTGLQHFMNGPESFTPDTKQVMGESPQVRNYFVAAGLNSLGIMSSPGVGKAMATWVVDGTPGTDLWEVDVARFDPVYADTAFLKARTQEAVANQLDMHWPFKQYKSGRNVKQSALYPAHVNAGAVFGATAGWERPLWFAHDEVETELVNSYGAQNWWPYAKREARMTADAVALYELSPFSKILIEGADALPFLQRMCCSDMDVDPGRVVYTLMLNAHGGIETELTVTRLSESAYCMVSAAATRYKDLAWLNRHVSEGEAVTITDHTEQQAVIGVMGPASRDLLKGLTASDVSKQAFAFATSQAIEVASCPLRAVRVSFVGELGFELYVDADRAASVYRALSDAGQAYGLIHAGLFSMEGCRLEKGYHHWGHDIGPQDTPLHAGLGFTVNYDKSSAFLGQEALLRQRETGVDRRLLLFQVEAEEPLLLHDEPIFRGRERVGLTTSGGLGFRTDLALCFGMVTKPDGMTLNELRSEAFEIELAGKRYAMAALSDPPYDPQGIRLRG